MSGAGGRPSYPRRKNTRAPIRTRPSPVCAAASAGLKETGLFLLLLLTVPPRAACKGSTGSELPGCVTEL